MSLILRKHAKLKYYLLCFSPLKFPFRDGMSVFILACVLLSTAHFDTGVARHEMQTRKNNGLQR